MQQRASESFRLDVSVAAGEAGLSMLGNPDRVIFGQRWGLSPHLQRRNDGHDGLHTGNPLAASVATKRRTRSISGGAQPSAVCLRMASAATVLAEIQLRRDVAAWHALIPPEQRFVAH
jgi:hypothetical protein